jgi:hypothetical protein
VARYEYVRGASPGMTLRMKLLLGAILAVFAAFHAVIWYNVASLLAAAQKEPAAMFTND